IDEVRISNSARTAEEIKLSAQRRPYGIYTSPVIDATTNESWGGNGEELVDDTNLVAQWNFNETSGTTATNNAGSCGANCNLTLTNFSNTSGQDVTADSGWTSTNKHWGAGALMCDGSNDYATRSISTADWDIPSSGDVSFETWVKTDTDGKQIFTAVSGSGTPFYSMSIGPTTVGGNNNVVVIYLRDDGDTL